MAGLVITMLDLLVLTTELVTLDIQRFLLHAQN
jgi:hypothetical protein